MGAFQKIKILGAEKSPGFSNVATVEINGIPLKLAQSVSVHLIKDQWITAEIDTIGDLDLETEGIVYFITEGRKFRVVEEEKGSE